MLKCICALTLSCRFTYCFFASIGHADIIWSIVSSSFWHSLPLLSVSVCSIFVALYFVRGVVRVVVVVVVVVIITLVIVLDKT
jgi:hypothetical protein